MKKLALVLGSLLVVGSVASAKEVVPAPMPAPEVIVKVVEKPVVVYRDRVVEDTKWRPNGYVSVALKTTGEIENTSTKDTHMEKELVLKEGVKKAKSITDFTTKDVVKNDRTWAGADPKARLELKAKINFTENQALEIRTRDWRGLTHRNNKSIERDDAYIQHTYDFGKINGTEIGTKLVSKYDYKKGNEQSIKEKVEFDFSNYFFKNDYFKTTAAVLAPNFTYGWDRAAHDENYALYANYEADFAYGVHFQAEFDNLFSYKKWNAEGTKATKTGSAELTLDKTFDLYAAGKHAVDTNLKGVYATGWRYSKTEKDGSKAKDRWDTYTAKFEPTLNYTYAATEYVKLHATLGAEYVNRVDAKSTAKRWRWQPYSEIGFKATF